MRWPYIGVIAGCCLFLACGATDRAAAGVLQDSLFSSFEGKTTLCFDLRSTNGVPIGGVVLRIGPGSSGRRDLLLPFAARDIRPNRALLLASGSYDRFTIFSMSIGNPSLGGSTVSFTPQLQPLNLATPHLDGLDPGVYFQQNGLERWFVFVDGSSAIAAELTRDFPQVELEHFDSIAVAIPEAAEGREVRKGFTIYPPPTVRLKNVMFFAKPPTSTSHRVEMRYAVPPSAAQIAASSSGLKLIFVLIIPVVSLIFLDPDDIQRPKLRHAAIWGGLSLQVLIVAFVIWGAVSTRQSSAEAWIDFSIAALGVICEVVVILVKSKAAPGTA